MSLLCLLFSLKKACFYMTYSKNEAYMKFAESEFNTVPLLAYLEHCKVHITDLSDAVGVTIGRW